MDYGKNKPLGGLVGRNGGTISNCYATARASGGNFTGGLVGRNGGTISNCYSLARVTGESFTGGLVGSNYGMISNCYAAGSVSGGHHIDIGGLAGANSGTISNCYSTARISGDRYTGGLVGVNGGTIKDCYASGEVWGRTSVGGLVGKNGGTISNCYATGSVTGYADTGGLIGCGGGVVNCFWDIETSSQIYSSGGKGKTTAQMKTASTFLGWAGCGNEDIWTIDEGKDYPRLSWQNLPGQPLPVQQLSDFLTGSGTAADPYLIYTAEQLNLIGVFICEWDKHFVLKADIDLSCYTGAQFNIVGTVGSGFTGIFDGNDYTISNFRYATTDTDCIGLFSYVDDANAVIKNLTLVDPNVNVGGYSYFTGCLVGRLESGTVTGCCIEGGSVTGDWYTGGLVGYNFYGMISNSYGTGSVEGYESNGGLVGWNDGTISNCYAEGNVTGFYTTGGLVGYNHGKILDCYGAANVTGRYYTGGLVGSNYGTISNCYAAGDVTGNSRTGGLVGDNYESVISNCYATGSVTGADYTGGLVGYNYKGMVSNCYAAGSVIGDRYTGGLVGRNRYGWISGCFWDINSSGMDISDGGEGKTTAQMQMQSTFANAGWDFDMPVWKICEAVDYPRLEWEMIDWPIIDEEPEVTKGTSNTISWQEVDEAIEYYVICCSDANLENVVAESGWVDVNEWTFDGLSTGQTYWYAVKARQNCVLESDWSDVVSSLQGTLSDVVENMLDADSLKNSNMKNALMNKIEQVLEMIDAGLYEDALKKLENDILKKTDGCFKTGRADKNDWITTCEEQQQIYPFVMDTIDYVNSLME